MTKTKSTYLALLAVLLSPMAANGTPIVITGPCENGSTECFTGILGLEVGSATYDVHWVEGLFDVAVASNPGITTFVGNVSRAAEASVLMTNLLFDAGGLLPLAYGDYRWVGAYVPYIVTEWEVASFVPISTRVEALNVRYDRETTIANWAVFTTVPEPGTLALLGIGLAGMGFSRRKKV